TGLDVYAQEAPQVAATDVEQQHAPKPPVASFDLLELRVKGNTLIDKNNWNARSIHFWAPKKV
ncbi:MAG: hypothetical protein ACXWTT_04905, partial [Methylobacter sp.]